MTISNVQNGQLNYGKLPAKEANEIPWNKLCVDIIGVYVIQRCIPKSNSTVKVVSMIEHDTGWFRIT